jgi:hypothetical protein
VIFENWIKEPERGWPHGTGWLLCSYWNRVAGPVAEDDHVVGQRDGVRALMRSSVAGSGRLC